MSERTCTVADCDRPAERIKDETGRGTVCTMHYQRIKRHGSPDVVLPTGFQPGHIPAKPFKRGYDPRRVFGFRPGEKHHNWRGDKVTYRGAHRRVERQRGSASEHACAHCPATASDWAYDHTDPDELIDAAGHPYSADPNHYIPLCRSCHTTLDRKKQEVSR